MIGDTVCSQDYGKQGTVTNSDKDGAPEVKYETWNEQIFFYGNTFTIVPGGLGNDRGKE